VFGIDLDMRKVRGTAIERIHTFNGREFHLRCIAGPIARGGYHQHWPGGSQCSDFDVVSVQSERRRVLALATALEMRGDHIHRCRHRNPIVESRQEHCLRRAPGGAGASDAAGIHLGQAAEILESREAVPQLQR